MSGRYTMKIRTAARKESDDGSRVRLLMKETFHGIKASLILAHVCRRGLELVTVRKLVDRRNKLEQRFRKLRLSAFDVRDPVLLRTH
jgi:hypothetical protein